VATGTGNHIQLVLINI